MIEAEQTEREVRRIQYQMTAAKFPHHKDFATFDYASSAIDKTIIEPLCTGQFALGVELIQRAKKTRFF